MNNKYYYAISFNLTSVLCDEQEKEYIWQFLDSKKYCEYIVEFINSEVIIDYKDHNTKKLLSKFKILEIIYQEKELNNKINDIVEGCDYINNSKNNILKINPIMIPNDNGKLNGINKYYFNNDIEYVSLLISYEEYQENFKSKEYNKENFSINGIKIYFDLSNQNITLKENKNTCIIQKRKSDFGYTKDNTFIIIHDNETLKKILNKFLKYNTSNNILKNILSEIFKFKTNFD